MKPLWGLLLASLTISTTGSAAVGSGYLEIMRSDHIAALLPMCGFREIWLNRYGLLDLLGSKYNAQSAWACWFRSRLNTEVPFDHTSGTINKICNIKGSITFGARRFRQPDSLYLGSRQLRGQMATIQAPSFARRPAVLGVVPMGSDFQIAGPVIQTIMVQMVGFQILGTIGNQSVKPERRALVASIWPFLFALNGGDDVESAFSLRFASAPRSRMGHHFLKSCRVHKGVKPVLLCDGFAEVSAPPQFHGEMVASVVPFVPHQGQYAMESPAESTDLAYYRFQPLDIAFARQDGETPRKLLTFRFGALLDSARYWGLRDGSSRIFQTSNIPAASSTSVMANFPEPVLCNLFIFLGGHFCEVG